MTPACALLMAVLAAQDAPSDFWTRSELLGDPGGVRSTLKEHGISLTLDLAVEVLSNVAGGVTPEHEWASLLDTVLDVDGKALVGWTGGSLHVDALWIEGGGLTDLAIRDLNRVSNIDAPPGFRVFEMWAQQEFLDGAFSIRAGILALDQEFAIETAALAFINSGFGAPVFLSANAPVPIYPVGSAGLRLRVEPAAGFYAQAAVYEGVAGPPRSNPSGLNVRFRSDDGVLSIVEGGWTHEGDLPGVAKVGGFYHSGDFLGYGTASIVGGLWGGYVSAEQRLWREREGSTAGLTAFARVGVSQSDRAVVSLGLDAGLVYTGLIPDRPRDLLMAGVVYARLGQGYLDSQPDPKLGYEIVVEWSYRMEVLPWFFVQPDFQVVIHPGATSRIPDAFVIGIRIDVLF